MAFERGDKVEVCLHEDGFKDSYYTATVVSRLPNRHYVVRYETLLEDHGGEELVETVRARDLRPLPPESAPSEFPVMASVDAFDNDGWWVGVISGEIGADGTYPVFFASSGDEISYPVSRLRTHLDWVRAKWVTPTPKKNDTVSKFVRMEIVKRGFENQLQNNNGAPLVNVDL